VHDEQLEVLLYGSPQLRKKSVEVVDFDEGLRVLARRMESCMLDERGIGLAAPQVGVHRRMLLAENRRGPGPSILCLVNPEIVDFSHEKDKYQEGCLSLPEIYADISRSVRVRVRFQDLEGHEREIEDDQMLARIIQHETDHLDGVLFVDHLSTLKRKLLSKRLRELSRLATERAAQSSARQLAPRSASRSKE
jgi:peptide deformylase